MIGREGREEGLGTRLGRKNEERDQSFAKLIAIHTHTINIPMVGTCQKGGRHPLPPIYVSTTEYNYRCSWPSSAYMSLSVVHVCTLFSGTNR